MNEEQLKKDFVSITDWPDKGAIADYWLGIMKKREGEITKKIKEWDDSPWLYVRFPGHLIRFEGVDNGGVRFSGEVTDISSELLSLLTTKNQ